MKRIIVPFMFWDDHADRAPVDADSDGICKEVRRMGNRVVLDCTPTQLSALRSDAAFYADPHCMDTEYCDASLIRSAKATLAAMARQGAA